MKNILIVYNNEAGRKKSIIYKKKLHKHIFKKANLIKFITTEELKNFNTAQYDTIIAMGGDGTINAIIPHIMNNDQKVLGIIPCGTANLLARKLKIPENFDKALKIFEQENKTKIDILKVNNTLCVLRLGIGYDADIICKTSQSLKHKLGYLAYLLTGIHFIFNLKKRLYTIICEEKQSDINASCIIVANASNMYKNQISVTKNCKLNDGYFDVFILKTTNPFLALIEVIKMYFKLHKINKNAMYFKTDKISIINKWMNTHVDGEKKNFKNNIDITIKNLAINVISPKE